MCRSVDLWDLHFVSVCGWQSGQNVKQEIPEKKVGNQVYTKYAGLAVFVDKLEENCAGKDFSSEKNGPSQAAAFGTGWR